MNTHDASGRSGASAFVEVTALRKSFDGTMALQGVSFGVALGTTVSLVGPLVPGKTSLRRASGGRGVPARDPARGGARDRGARGRCAGVGRACRPWRASGDEPERRAAPAG